MAKEPSGESPPTDSDPFSEAEFGKNLVNLSNRFAAKRESPIQAPETQSAFHLLAQLDPFRYRDVRLQSKSFARLNQQLKTQLQLDRVDFNISRRLSR